MGVKVPTSHGLTLHGMIFRYAMDVPRGKEIFISTVTIPFSFCDKRRYEPLGGLQEADALIKVHARVAMSRLLINTRVSLLSPVLVSTFSIAFSFFKASHSFADSSVDIHSLLSHFVSIVSTICV